MLVAADPEAANIGRVIVWGARATLDSLPTRPWLELVHVPALDKDIFRQRFWQTYTLRSLSARSIDILFAPGGSYQGAFRPFVTMSRNMLPFDPPERARYNGTLVSLRLRALSLAQKHSLRRADGVIFLTRTAERLVTARTGPLRGLKRVIPHGLRQDFFVRPRPQQDLQSYSMRHPFRWIYVSIVDLYKHQPAVAEAVGAVRAKGLPVSVDFVGPAYAPALKQLRATIAKFDPQQQFLHYRGSVSHAELPGLFQRADAAVFASSCENLPNILLESMAAGLPIACSERSVMPEVLDDAGVYFDPESADSIAAALQELMMDRELRQRCASRAYERATQYSWDRCARETLQFISRVAENWRAGQSGASRRNDLALTST